MIQTWTQVAIVVKTKYLKIEQNIIGFFKKTSYLFLNA